LVRYAWQYVAMTPKIFKLCADWTWISLRAAARRYVISSGHSSYSLKIVPAISPIASAIRFRTILCGSC
jgi:hypothetical protein